MVPLPPVCFFTSPMHLFSDAFAPLSLCFYFFDLIRDRANTGRSKLDLIMAKHIYSSQVCLELIYFIMFLKQTSNVNFVVVLVQVCDPADIDGCRQTREE